MGAPVRAVSRVIGGAVSALTGSAPSAPAPSPQVTAAQERAEARAEAQTREDVSRMAARRRARRTGGLRLLMSPARQEGPQTGMRRTLGPGS